MSGPGPGAAELGLRPSQTGGLGTRRGQPPPLRVCVGGALGRPRAEGHLHWHPRLRPGLRTWGPWKGSHGGHTRARSWGHVRAHAVWFQGAPPPQADGIGGPTPLRAPAWGALPAGDADTWRPSLFLVLLVLDVPVRQSCSPMSEVQFEAAQTWDCGKSASWGLCVLWGCLSYTLRDKGLLLGRQAMVSFLSVIGRHLIWVLGSYLCWGAKPTSLAGEVFVPELDH